MISVACAAPEDKVLEIVEQMARTERAIRDVTVVMHKRERIDGKLSPSSTIFIKFRKPHAVYAKWTSGPNKGREVIWAKGWNDGKLKASAGLLVLDLDPKGWMAMRGQRHPITELGPSYMMKRIVKDTRAVQKSDAWKSAYTLLPDRSVHGVRARCWRGRMPKKLKLYADEVEICVDDKARPLLMHAFELQGEKRVLVEEYTFANLVQNPGLTDNDFNPRNRDYDF